LSDEAGDNQAETCPEKPSPELVLLHPTPPPPFPVFVVVLDIHAALNLLRTLQSDGPRPFAGQDEKTYNVESESETSNPLLAHVSPKAFP